MRRWDKAKKEDVQVTINYNGMEIQTAGGKSLLAILQQHGIEHIHACGGKARCSTCRVLVLSGELPPKNEAESLLTERKGLPPNVRLACQMIPQSDMHVRPLVRDEDDLMDALTASPGSPAMEREVAILFSDIRNFTGITEQNEPYDLMHALQKYVQIMSKQVADHNGFVDKVIGDGLMCIFGLGGESAAESCHQALATALDMESSLEELNRYIEATLATPFRIGIGIHYGKVITGEFGFSGRKAFTAIGDTVNLAARIESATKAVGVPLLASAEVIRHSRKEVIVSGGYRMKLKGKSGEHAVYAVTGLKQRHPPLVNQGEFITARKTNQHEIAQQTFALTFHTDHDFRFKPGQYVEVQLPETMQSRILSIANPPLEGNGHELQFAFRNRPSHFKADLLMLPVGSPVRIRRARGSFFSALDEQSAPLIFIAGGIGITPIRSIVLDLISRKDPHEVTLIYSNRTVRGAPYLEELLELRSPGFTLMPLITAEPVSAPLLNQRLSVDFFADSVPHIRDAQIYLSGPMNMVGAVETMLEELLVDPGHIHTEVFSGY